MGESKEEKYLERLTRAFLSLDAEKHVNTKEFNEAVDAILPVFDYLGKFLGKYHSFSGMYYVDRSWCT